MDEPFSSLPNSIWERPLSPRNSISRTLTPHRTGTRIGCSLDVVIESGSFLPLIGASGGISGLLVYYGLRFPHAQLAVMYRFEWREFSAWRLLKIWALLQMVGAFLPLHGVSHVASLAHLGGGLAGAIFWLIWKIHPFESDSIDDTIDSSNFE